MRIRRFTYPLLVLATAVVTATSAAAAVDPDLTILDKKVDGVGAAIKSTQTKVSVVGDQLKQQFDNNERGLIGYGDARRRDLEKILLACAVEPATCLPPALLSSAFDPRCLLVTPFTAPPSAAPGGPPVHSHDTGCACPLRESLKVVQFDRDAAQAGGLARNYAAADAHLAAAETARLASDGWTSFLEACAAFKVLACPDKN